MSLPDGMRTVVLFSARYLPNMGGVEFFTANLGERLAAKGFKVIVVTTEPGDESPLDVCHQLGEGSLEVVRLDAMGPKRMPVIRRNAHNRAAFARIEREAPFHALINTRFYDLSTQAARLCARVGVTPVLIDHGTGHIAFPSRVLSWASRVGEHAITTRLKRYPLACYGVSRDASRWLATFGIDSRGEIHNAIDAQGFRDQASERDFRAEYGVSPSSLCVAYTARLLADKGADVILEAARRLQGDARLHFFIAGSGPMEEEVAQAARTLTNFDYLGRLDHPDIASLLVTCDTFCFPTRYSEGLPTALLEAGACSCALVASHAGGVDEIITTEQNGIILEPPDAQELCRILQMLAADPARLHTLQEGSHTQVSERFSWERTIEELLAAFRSAAVGPAHKPEGLTS